MAHHLYSLRIGTIGDEVLDAQRPIVWPLARGE
ncbi:hypothetical protein ABIA06_002975 [Bradyrhizobium yuanmingense]